MLDAARLSVGTLTAVPVPAPRTVDQRTAGRAMLLAPAVGLALALPATGVGLLAEQLWNPTVGAVAAVTTLALLTRGLHLDGLADTADGLGSGRTGAAGVAVMRRSDIGPFGVVTLVLHLMATVALLSLAGPTALLVAVPTGRLAATLACTVGIPAADLDGLGRSVAGTVRLPAALLVTAATVIGGVALAGPSGAVAIAVGLAAAALLLHRCVRRFGGITGDVLGGCVEVGGLAALAVLAGS